MGEEGKINAHWIAADWGTSCLRAWAMDETDTVLAHATSKSGMGGLDKQGFEPALLSLVGNWLPENANTQVIICGMAGAKQGWKEAPYRMVPCTPHQASSFVTAPTLDHRLNVQIIGGLSQNKPADDVMRGEETQIAGFLHRDPKFDGVICLPGTHTKWAHVSAGEVVSFVTFMTGEMFSLLSSQSVLSHGLGQGWDDAAFDAGVDQTRSRPESLMSKLFGIRAEGLLSALSPDAARARLSGLLIGSELAAARMWWLGQDVVVLGNDALSACYLRALETQGAMARAADASQITLEGLCAARTALNADAGDTPQIAH